MESKDLCMWVQVVCSTDKHFMAMDLLQCPPYPRLPHLAHGVAAAPAAAPLRSPVKISQRLTEMQNVKN